MRNIFNTLTKRRKSHTSHQEDIFVVSGLPRSGTSMMMKMVEAGGIEVMVDNLREADTDNPKGYYELERVKQLDKGDKAWVVDARGKVVKVIATLLTHLPPEHQYRVLFMNRKVEEVIKSQNRMLENRKEDTDKLDEDTLHRLLAKHAQDIKSWVLKQPNFQMMEVDYNALVMDPLAHVKNINEFLGNNLDEQAMATVVDPDLYRNRKSA